MNTHNCVARAAFSSRERRSYALLQNLQLINGLFQAL